MKACREPHSAPSPSTQTLFLLKSIYSFENNYGVASHELPLCDILTRGNINVMSNLDKNIPYRHNGNTAANLGNTTLCKYLVPGQL